MPRVHIYGFNLTERDLLLARAMVKPIATGIDLSITDLRAYDLKRVYKTDTEIVITYGAKATRECIPLPNPMKIEMPEPYLLYNTPGNETYREDAARILTELNSVLVSGVPGKISKVTEIPKPFIDTVSIDQIAKLYTAMIAQKQSHWVCTLDDNKKICISVAPQVDVPADYHITFQELYTLSLCKELLKVKEVQIVSHSD